MATTKQTVTYNMTAKQMQRLPKETTEALKGTLLVEKVRRCCTKNECTVAYRIAKVKVVATHAHSGNRLGHAHNRHRMIVHNSC